MIVMLESVELHQLPHLRPRTPERHEFASRTTN